MQAVKPFTRMLQLALKYPDLNPPLLELMLYSGKVAAGPTTGFPSPAQDYEQERLDLNKKLIANPSATFFYYIGQSDDSMIDVGIHPSALIIVDRSTPRKSGKNVLAVIDGEYIVKELYVRGKACELRSRNEQMNYAPIRYKEGMNIEIEGVVMHAVNSY